MSLIIKNITSGGGAVTVNLDDIGLELPSQATYDLANEQASDVYRSQDLISAIQAGEIRVLDPLDDTTELSSVESQQVIEDFNDPNWRHGRGARIGDNNNVNDAGIVNGQALVYTAGTYLPGDIEEGVDRLQAYYVNKHGNDSNSGKRPSEAFLTFGAAIAAVNGQTPSTTNRFAVVCDDGGVYAESFTIPSWCQVNAETVKIEGTVTMSDNSEARIREIEAATNGTAVQKLTGGGTARVIAEILRTDGTGDTVINSSAVTGVLIIHARQVFVEDGTAVIDNSTAAAGHIHVDIEDVYITGSGSAIDSNTVNGFVVGKVSHILEIGGGVGNGTAFTISTGRVDMLVGYIEADIAYNISGAGRLRLIVNELGGTRVQTSGAATVDVLEANSLRWITITDVHSPYTPRRIEFLNIDTTNGPVEVDLAATASDGDVIWFQDANATFATNNLTLDANGNTISGQAQLVVGINSQSGFAVFQAATNDWSVTFNAEAAFSPDNVIYVTKNGNDVTGDGSFSNPYLTVKKGAQEAEIIASASNPTTVKILDGIYDEINPIPLTGTNSQFITLQGSQEQSVIVRPTVNGQPLMDMSSAGTGGPTLSRMSLMGQNNGGTDYEDVAGGDLVRITGNGRFFTDKVLTSDGYRGFNVGNGTITTEQRIISSFATSRSNTVAIEAKGNNVKFVGQVVYLVDNDQAVDASGTARVELGNFEVAGDGATGTGIIAKDSSVVFLNSGYVRDNVDGVRGEDTSTITGAGIFFENNTNDIHQVDAGAVIQLQGFISKVNQIITDGTNVSLNYINTDDGDFIVGNADSTGDPGKEFRVRDADGRIFIGDNATNENGASNTVGGSRSINLIDENGNMRIWRFTTADGEDPSVEWVKGVNPAIADDEGTADITGITAASVITIDVSGTEWNEWDESPPGIGRSNLAGRAFPNGREIRVNGTTSNDGDYTVASAVYNSGPQTIDVTVNEATTLEASPPPGSELVFGGGAGRPDGVSTYVGDPGAAVAAGVGNVHWDFFLQEDDYWVVRRRTRGGGTVPDEKLRVFSDAFEIIGATTYDNSDNNLIARFEMTEAGADDYFVISNSAAGNPEIEAVGADTDINILLTPKGTGTVLVPVGYEANITDDSLITKQYLDDTLGELPVVQVRRSTTLAVPTTWGDITFDTTDVENDPTVIEHNNTTTDNIDIKEDGLYGIAFHASVDADAGEETIEMRARVNDTTVIPGSLRTISEDDEINDIGNVFYYTFTAGDFITFQHQASGAGNVLSVNSTYSIWKMRGAQGPAGPAGTGATIEVEDEGASLGTNFTTLNFIGEGVTAVANGTTADITIPTKNTQFHGHNGAVTQTFTTTATTINFGTNVRQDSDYTAATVVGGTEVTINRGGTNWFKITYDLGIDISTGTSRSNSRSELQVNTVAVPGSQGYGYHRTSAAAEQTVSKTVTLQLTQNDVVRVQSVRLAGTSTLITLANSCTLTIEKVDAP